MEDRASTKGGVQRVGSKRPSRRNTNPMIRRLWLAKLRSKLKPPVAACEASGAPQSHKMLCGMARLQQCAESTGDTCFPHTRAYGRRAVKTERELGQPGCGAAGNVRLGERSQSNHSSESQERNEGMREILWHRRETRRERRRQRTLWSHGTEL